METCPGTGKLEAIRQAAHQYAILSRGLSVQSSCGVVQAEDYELCFVDLPGLNEAKEFPS